MIAGKINHQLQRILSLRKQDASASNAKNSAVILGWVKSVVAAILALVIALPLPALAQVTSISRQLPFSARLANTDNIVAPDGSYTMTFRIYTSATGGTALWEEVQAITVTDGAVYARLGSVTPLPSTLNFNGSDYYLGITIAGEPSELSPRRQIGAVPTAINADTVDGAHAGTGANNVLQLDGEGDIDIAGGASFGGTLNVVDSASFASTLSVTGATTLAGALTVSSGATFDGTTLVVDADNNRVGIGAATPSALLHVSGVTEQLRLGYDDTNYVSFTTDASGNLTINPTGGQTTITGTLNASQSSVSAGQTVITSATSPQLTVQYDASNYFTQSVSSTGAVAFDVTGSSAGFTFADAVAVNSTLSATGTVSLGSTLGVTGATTLSSTLGVTGAATLTSTLSVGGDTTLSGTLNVTGATAVSSTFAVTGATTLSSTLVVTGNTAFSANIGIGGAATTDPLTIYTPSGDNGFALQINDPLSGTHGGIDFYNDAGGTQLFLAANASYQQTVGLTVINSADPASLISLDSRTSGDIAFYTANVSGSIINTMRIVGGTSTYAGSVVIGESSPTTLLANSVGWGKVLQIQDNVHVALSLRDTGTNDQIDLAADGGTFRIYDAGDSAYRMWIDTDGRVALGDTTGIDAKLQVNAGSSVAEALRLKSDHASYTFASIYNATGTKWDIVNNNSGVGYGSEGDLNIMRAGGARIALGKDGGVAIGTSVVSTTALYVNKSSAVTSADYGLYVNNVTTNSTTDSVNKYGLYVNSTGTWTGSTGTATNNYGLYVAAPSGADNNYAAYFGGNIGIGDTSPTALLTVGTGDAFQVNASGNITTSGSLTVAGAATFGTYSAGATTLDSLTVTNNASVGGALGVTGATTLSSTLAVTGNSTFDSGTLFVDASNNRVGINNASPSYNVDIAGSAGVLMYLRPGTGVDADDAYISVNNRVRFGYDGTTESAIIDDANANGSSTGRHIIFKTGGSERMRISSNGRTGIGTDGSNPAAVLHLAGDQSGTSWTTNGRLLRVSAGTYTDTSSIAGTTIGTRASSSFSQPTLASTNAITVTDAATLYIANAPAAGTNTTISNAHALWVDDGSTRLDGTLTVGGAAIFSDSVTFSSTVSAGAATLSSLTVTNNALIGGTLGVTGATTLSSTLSVTGNAAFNTNTLFVDAANNRVGVGTATPDELFHVQGPSGGAAKVVITNNGYPLQAGSDSIVGAHFGLRGGKGLSFAAAGDLIPINISLTGATSVAANTSALGRSAIPWGALYVTGFSVSSSKVAIGSITPTGQLSFSAAESNTPAIRFQNSAGSSADAAITTFDSGSATELYLGSNVYISGVGLVTRFDTAAASSLIGLTPSGFEVRTGGTGANPTQNFRVDSSGNAAFNSSILPSSAGWAKTVAIHHDSHAALSISNSGQKFDWGVDANKLSLYDDTDDAYRMVVDTDGNVGIGIASPTALLHLAGARSAASWTTNGLQLQVAAATLTDTTGSGTITYRVANSIGQPTFASSSATTLTTAATLYIAGAPLAGTNTAITNSYALDVSGDIRLRSGSDPTLLISHVAGAGTTFTSNRQINLSSGAEMTFTADVDNGDGAQRVFTFKGGVGNYMTLDRGNLAIGTTTPSARLHVQSIGFSASSWLTNGVGLRFDAASFSNTSGGTAATAVIHSFGQPTLTASSATTTTHASNLYVAGAPTAGTNQAITSSSALRVASAAVAAATTNAYGLYVQAPTGATNNYAAYLNGPTLATHGTVGWTMNGVVEGTTVFTSETSALKTPAFVAVGGFNSAFAVKTNPLGGAFGTMGLLGAAGNGGGSRNNIGVYGYAIQQAQNNTSNKAAGGVFISELQASANYPGTTYGVYATTDLTAAVNASLQGVGYAVYGAATGATNTTVYGGYFTATGGTVNYDLMVDNATGGNLTLRRNDSVVDSGDVIGAVSFENNEASLTTQRLYGKIEVQAAQAISTDAAASNMLFYTTGTSVGGSPTERMRIRHDGNVGIGSTNPGSLLTLSAAAGTTMGISLGTNTDSITASRYIGITNSTNHGNLSANQGFSGIEFGGPSSADEGYIAIHTHDAGSSSGERLRIDKSGNVGIGTGSTVSGKLHINADDIAGTYGMVMTANSLSTGRALHISSTSTAGGASSNSYMAVFERSGANVNTAHTAYGVYSTVTNTNATSGTNIAGYFSASGATTANYGLLVASGNAGFGTTAPTHQAQVTGGSLCVGSDASCGTVANTQGIVYSSATAMSTYDLAENYPTKDKTLVATEIVELDPSNEIFVRRATGTNNNKLLGIISEEPGVLLGGFNGQQYKNERQVAVALSGRVRVKMDPASPAVAVGDPLTASTKPGYATKATGSGTIIGRAMEAWVPGTGKQLVMTFVQTQQYNPELEVNFAEELQTKKVVTELIQSPEGKDLAINTQQLVVNGKLVVNEAVTITKTFATPASATQTLTADNQILANATKVKVVGDGTAVALVGTPQIADAADGQLLIIQGTDDVKTVTVKDQGESAGSNLELGAATRTLGKGDILTLTFDEADSVWYEVSFTDN